AWCPLRALRWWHRCFRCRSHVHLYRARPAPTDNRRELSPTDRPQWRSQYKQICSFGSGAFQGEARELGICRATRRQLALVKKEFVGGHCTEVGLGTFKERFCAIRKATPLRLKAGQCEVWLVGLFLFLEAECHKRFVDC